MSPLLHYGRAGSASPDYLRACREIEADCGPLSAAPLPRPYAALSATYERHLAALRVDPDLARYGEPRLSRWAQEDALAEFVGGIEAAEWLAAYVRAQS